MFQPEGYGALQQFGAVDGQQIGESGIDVHVTSSRLRHNSTPVPGI
jgi:hypothetical protein